MDFTEWFNKYKASIEKAIRLSDIESIKTLCELAHFEGYKQRIIEDDHHNPSVKRNQTGTDSATEKPAKSVPV